jgi:hypothetical protein
MYLPPVPEKKQDMPQPFSIPQCPVAIDGVLDCRQQVSAPLIRVAPSLGLVSGQAVGLMCSGILPDGSISLLQLREATPLSAIEEIEGLLHEVTLAYLQRLKHNSQLQVTLMVDDSQAASTASFNVLTLESGPGVLAPARPGSPHIVPTANTLIVAWSSSQDATGYEVAYGLDADQVVIDKPTTTYLNHTIRALRSETKYFVEVRAYNADGQSAPSRKVATTLAATAKPSAPTNPGARPTKDTVVLTWSGSDLAAGYKVSYGLLPNGPVINTITSIPQTCIVSGLTSNTAYYFDLLAFNGNGDSPSVRITATTLQVPASPTSLSAVPAVIIMDLAWSGSVGATGYVIRYGVEPNGPALLEQTSYLTHTLKGLTHNTLYFVEVSATNNNGESLPARITQKTLDGRPIPDRPSNLFIQVNFDTVRISWNAPQEPGYEITYGIDDADRVVIGRETTTHLTYLIKHLAFETKYFIEVRAFNESGSSQPSMAVATVGADQTQPRNLRNPGRTFSEAWLTWERPVDTSYFRDYEITCSGRQPVHTTALEYIATGLTPGVEYLFKVQPRRLESANPARHETISVVTHDQVPPTRPQALKLSWLTSGSATLSWRASEDNVGVTGYMARCNGGAWAPVTETRHTFSGLVEGATNRFEVRAKDAGGNLSLVTSATFNSKDVVPPGKYPPRNLRITSNAGGTVRFDWDAPQNTSGFLNYLYYFLGIPLPVLELTLTVSKLKPGQEYAFVIAAKYETGNSEQVSLTFTANP